MSDVPESHEVRLQAYPDAIREDVRHLAADTDTPFGLVDPDVLDRIKAEHQPEQKRKP